MSTWKTAIVPTLFVALSMSVPVCLRADAGADAARKAVAAQYAKMDAALCKKDLATFGKCCTSDFINIDEKGKKTNLEQTKQEMGQVLAASQTFKFSTTVQSCQVSGNKVTVHAKQHAAATIKNPQTGKTSIFAADTVVDDVWTKSGANYLLKASKTASAKSTLDGKPMQ